MDHIPDHEATVVLHQLCEICQQAVTFFAKEGSWDSKLNVEEESSDGGTPRPGPYVRYHASFHDLRDSAAKGCHLCTIFVREFRESYVNTSEDQLYIHSEQDTMGMRLKIKKDSIRLHDDVTMRRLGDRSSTNPDIVAKHQTTLEDRIGRCISTGAPIGFQMIRSWLEQCVADHEVCRRGMGDLWPARLLDLNEFANCDDLRLVLTSEVGKKPYATLSYSWGKNNNLTLSSGNYDNFRSRIRYNALPATIRDAVAVCRNLSIRYLWVDALCIIQGDSRDFAQEVSRMGSIYAASLITVAAGNSSHCESGIFTNRQPLMEEYCMVEIDGSMFRFARRHWRNCGYHDTTIPFSVLNSRAWVFQEHMMSPRTIQFINDEIIWECRTLTMCRHCVDTKFVSQGIKDTYVRLHQDQDVSKQQTAIRNSWPWLMSRYSLLVLSDEEDRLNALAGIAQLVHRCGYQTSYGLLLADFLNEILWQITGAILREGRNSEELNHVPSWSWLSSHGQMRHLSTMQDQTGEKLYHGRILRLPIATSFDTISRMTLRWPPHTTRVRIKGHLRSCRVIRLRLGSTWTLAPMSGEIPPKDDTLEWLAYASPLDAYPDHPAVFEEGDHAFCLLVKRITGAAPNAIGLYDANFCVDPKRTTDWGLILRPINPELGIF